MKNSRAPIFIVGMNGSGTTMLLDSLGRHPQIYAFPRETRLIPYLVATQAQFGDLNDDLNFRALWDSVLSLSVFERVNDQRKLRLPNDWRECQRDLASVLDSVFLGFAGREGKSRWCEKTPQHAQHLELLASMYPDARFIHVIRDGRDCAASFNRRWRRSPLLTIYRWKKLVSECQRQARNLPAEQYMEVHYENLTVNPGKWLRQICVFLNVPFDAAILESSRPYLQTAKSVDESDTGPGLQHNTGKWRTHFSPTIQQRLELIGGRTLHRLGYQTSHPDADVDLTAFEIKLLAFRDAVVQFAREISLKLQGKIERPWRLILAKPFVARKHRASNRF